MLAASAEHVIRTEVRVTDPQLHTYLRLRMMHMRHEELFVVFLDSGNRFIRAQAFTSQQSNKVTAEIANIYQQAIDSGSYGLLLAHNHPSGDHTPSGLDCRANDRLKDAGAALGITLVDHLIVAGNTIFSMHEGRAL